MRKQNSEFKTAFTSEAGQDLKNTDYFGFVELDQYACYVIADGIDDHVDVLSAKLAVGTIISAFLDAPSMRKHTVRRCLERANRALLQAKSKMRLKASVTMVITDYKKLRYGQAGNTRLRLYRDGFLKLWSQDNSLSRDLVAEEKLEPDKLAQHEERNNLYCYLGQEKEFKPYLSKKFKLSNADALALFTRGVWEHVDDGELADAFGDATDDPQPTVDAVEDLLLSSQPQEIEKYTFVAIFFNKVFIDPNSKRRIKKIILITAIVLLVAVVVTVVVLVLRWRRIRQIQAMEQSFYDTVEYIQADNYIRAEEECQKALDLAERVRDQAVQKDASNYMKLIESVIAGDDKLNGEDFADAQRDYRNARNRARYADNLGMDYIEERLNETASYLAVYDLISLGDTLTLNLQYDKAEEQYLAAKALAGKIYFDQGRDDAMTALETLYAAQKDEKEQQAADAQQAAEEQSAAAGVLSEGDAAFAQGDYEGAKAFYATALQKYTALEDQAQMDVLAEKLASTVEKLDAQKELEAEAEAYLRQGENAYLEKNYIQAKKYYLLAKDVYAGLKNDSKVSEINRRMELVEMGVSEEERAEREAAAEEEQRRQENAAAESPSPAQSSDPEASPAQTPDQAPDQTPDPGVSPAQSPAPEEAPPAQSEPPEAVG